MDATPTAAQLRPPCAGVLLRDPDAANGVRDINDSECIRRALPLARSQYRECVVSGHQGTNEGHRVLNSVAGFECDTSAFLASFCRLAIELYPGQDWATVEPRLVRSWEAQQHTTRCPWSEVRELVRQRWCTLRPYA